MIYLPWSGREPVRRKADDKVGGMGARARKAARTLAVLGPEKEAALHKAAQALLAHEEEILMANREDLAAGEGKGLTPALLDRLRLTPERIASMAAAMEEVASGPTAWKSRKLPCPWGWWGLFMRPGPM